MNPGDGGWGSLGQDGGINPGPWQGGWSQALPLDSYLGRKQQAGPEQVLQGDENCWEWPEAPLVAPSRATTRGRTWGQGWDTLYSKPVSDLPELGLGKLLGQLCTRER